MMHVRQPCIEIRISVRNVISIKFH